MCVIEAPGVEPGLLDPKASVLPLNDASRREARPETSVGEEALRLRRASLRALRRESSCLAARGGAS